MFSWGKKGRSRLRRAQVVEQKRSAYRASVEFPVLYAVSGRAGSRAALATDLSAGGLRLIGDEDLPAGTLLEFRFTLPTDQVRSVQVEKRVPSSASGSGTKTVMVPPAPFEPMEVQAKVVLAFFSTRRKKLSHGVQFLDVDDNTKEELQRFIHVWQVRQLRERAARE